uniref:Cell adhesion molecule L1-like b n=1 Tax=Gasterosteus aculeatus aculeatus TaxID=481459 RepID=G3NVB9_GASAC
MGLVGKTLSLMVTFNTFMSLHIAVEQPPTIITHTSGPIVALPFDNTITIRCEARGNPPPEYRWTKDGEDFVPPYVTTDHPGGTFELHNKGLQAFQGKYRCYASNELGTAMTEEIELRVPSMPKFPKEFNFPVVVKEGEPIVLECNPPEGMAPRQIYWMSSDLKHIEQDERVSMGIDGNLYFSNALQNDSRADYCCFAHFSKIRTIVQKTQMAVVVKSCRFTKNSLSQARPARRPSLLLPSGVQTEKVLLKGENLQLECIPQGYPTPTVKWMKMGDKLPLRTQLNNFGKLLFISSVDESDGGKYMCKGQNPAGEVVHYFDVIVEDPPKWETEPPQSQLTVIGTDVHIKCSVSGKPPPDITWRRNGDLFRDDLGSNNKQVFDDTLVFLNAGAQDSAVYQCEASNTHGSILANINVMVMNMAPRILTRDFQEYAVVRGKDVVMNCSVFSSPPPNISWVKDETLEIVKGERFSDFGGSLKIFSAEKSDSGKYLCVASNTEGNSSVAAILDVKDSTKIVHPPQDMRIISGTTAQLTCQAEVDKSLRDAFEVVWRKDGEEIPLSSEENPSDGMLQIMSVNLDDQGSYMCIARTILDEDNATALLTVLDVPDAPKNLEILELKSQRNVCLSWVPGSDHNSSVTEFIVEYEESQWEPGRWKELKKVAGNQATAEVALQGDLNYQFRVYAVNVVGPGPPSEPTERYKTPPAAPEKNPENIKIQGPLPHQLDISWEPLLPMEHNGPGLEYKVSYRKLGVEDVWKEHLVKRHSFVVRNTSTFIPFEIKIQSRNSHGWGPDPKVVTGYSGEDVPTAAPRDVAVEVINTTVLRVSWTPAPPATVRGHLGGYDVHWLRKRSWLEPNKILDDRKTLSFPGKRTLAIVPGLEPFSEYMLTVNVFNKKGNGPNSDPVTFNTPEGEQVPILTASNAQKDSVLLVWAPPRETNGILTGYLLQHHLELINHGDVLSHGPLMTLSLHQVVGNLFTSANLFSCVISPFLRVSVFLSSLFSTSYFFSSPVPALLNISSYVSDTFAKISWIAETEQQDSELYVAYMNNREGNWLVSEAVNASRRFHVIDGLKPGTVYTVRLMAKRLVDNASIFEDVIQTRVKGAQRSNFLTHGWFIGTMCAVALLTLVALMACFVRRNQGGKYLHVCTADPDHPSLLVGCSDGEEKPLKGGSLLSLTGDEALGDSVSRDSMADYGNVGREFNEDGSFIGEYSGFTHRGSVSEPSGPQPVTA